MTTTKQAAIDALRREFEKCKTKGYRSSQDAALEAVERFLAGDVPIYTDPTTESERERWEVDDLVQISPTWDERFAGSILVVDKVKKWGVRGYVVVPDSDGPSFAYYRLPFESTKAGCSVTGVRVGRAYWLDDRARE